VEECPKVQLETSDRLGQENRLCVPLTSAAKMTLSEDKAGAFSLMLKTLLVLAFT
jgi:hypothetical protein